MLLCTCIYKPLQDSTPDGAYTMFNKTKSFFHRKTDMERQMEEFFCYKAMKSFPAAENHSEWLKVFCKAIGKPSVLEIDRDDLDYFVEYIQEAYKTDFSQSQAIHSVNCFLRFFKCGIMIPSNKMGRPLNKEAVEMAKKYNNMGLSVREVAAVLKSKGFSGNTRAVHYWIKHPYNKQTQ